MQRKRRKHTFQFKPKVALEKISVKMIFDNCRIICDSKHCEPPFNNDQLDIPSILVNAKSKMLHIGKYSSLVKI